MALGSATAAPSGLFPPLHPQPGCRRDHRRCRRPRLQRPEIWVRARQLALRANLPRAAVAAVDSGVGYAHPPEGGRVQSRSMRDDNHSAGLCAGRRPAVAPPVQWHPRVGPL